MKPIRNTFVSDGYTFRQIAREKNVAVYEKVWGSHHTWEVIKVRQRGERLLKGKHLEASEQYPTSESWGEDGWSLTTKESAFAWMDKVLRDEETKQNSKTKTERNKQE